MFTFAELAASTPVALAPYAGTGASGFRVEVDGGAPYFLLQWPGHVEVWQNVRGTITGADTVAEALDLLAADWKARQA